MKISREEFVRLATAELDAVDRVARSLTRDSASADDLVQETYLRALRACEQFDLQQFGVRPWLLRILHNTHINRQKRERRQPAAMESNVLESVAPQETEAIALDANQINDDELNAALDQLPSDLRTIMMLWAVDELSYKEMAHVLEIPIGTVMSRIHRARRQVYEMMPRLAGKRAAARE